MMHQTPKSSLAHQAPHATQRVQGTVRVRATKRGFYDHHEVNPGDEFAIPAGEKLGSWMELVNDDRSSDQDAAMEKALVDGALPDHDRREAPKGGKKSGKSENDVL